MKTPTHWSLIPAPDFSAWWVYKSEYHTLRSSSLILHIVVSHFDIYIFFCVTFFWGGVTTRRPYLSMAKQNTTTRRASVECQVLLDPLVRTAAAAAAAPRTAEASFHEFYSDLLLARGPPEIGRLSLCVFFFPSEKSLLRPNYWSSLVVYGSNNKLGVRMH